MNIKQSERKLFKKRDKFIHQRTKGEKIVFTIAFVLLAIHTVSLIYPFIWMFISSLKNNYDYTYNSPFGFPEVYQWENYIKVFSLLTVRGHGFLTMIWNSVWWTVGNTILGIFMSCVVAYVLAKYEFKGRKLIYNIIILVMIIPIFGSGAAAYKQAQDLNIINSPLLLIKSLGGYGGFQFLILYAFFKNIPWDYAESAFIDGASDFKVFTRIMIPIAKGPIISLAIIAAIGSWNDYMTPLVYLYDYPTLATGLYIFENQMQYYGAQYPLYFTGIIITLIPILIVFISFQKTIMSNVNTGGLKG